MKAIICVQSTDAHRRHSAHHDQIQGKGHEHPFLNKNNKAILEFLSATAMGPGTSLLHALLPTDMASTQNLPSAAKVDVTGKIPLPEGCYHCLVTSAKNHCQMVDPCIHSHDSAALHGYRRSQVRKANANKYLLKTVPAHKSFGIQHLLFRILKTWFDLSSNKQKKKQKTACVALEHLHNPEKGEIQEHIGHYQRKMDLSSDHHPLGGPCLG